MKTLHEKEAIMLLKEKGIHITQTRLEVLKIIYNQCQSIFGVGAFLKLNTSVNRISVHRVLQLFVKKEILATVPNTKGVVEYTLPFKAGGKNEHSPARKFICKKCGSITYEVLPQINIVPALLLATTMLTL